MKIQSTCLALVTIALLAACQKENSQTVESNSAPSEAVLQIITTPPTGDPVPIHQIRTTAKAGDPITVSGRIMGNMSPFVEGRSIFILGDKEVLTACSDIPDDNCETPWDNCCDSKEDKKRGIATVQLVDANGSVLKESVEGVGGLAKLSNVTVSGTVAEGSSADLLIINAQAIQIAR